ncbi:MAG: 4Fe-4S binding protein [Armatimonadota bacterium]
MPHVIDESLCVSCGLCADACPADAISEGENAFVIDADLCTDCDLCTSECPSEAISEK